MRGCKFRIRRGFQSTPPSRVATGCYVQPLQISWRISIHTTLAGGDTRFSAGRCSTKNYFNPHHPRGWRRLRRVFLSKQTDFNPHHPRGWRQIIHIGRRSHRPDFNPHHPRGWRPATAATGTAATDFNPHHPRGWRRPLLSHPRHGNYFNPHHPRGWRPSSDRNRERCL